MSKNIFITAGHSLNQGGASANGLKEELLTVNYPPTTEPMNGFYAPSNKRQIDSQQTIKTIAV